MTPIYDETVRATGTVPDGCPSAAEIPVGSYVLELPTFRKGVTLVEHEMPTVPLIAIR